MTARTRARGGLSTTVHLGDSIDDRYRTKTITPYNVSYVTSQEKMVDEIHPQYPYEGGPMNLQRVERSHIEANGWFGTKRQLTNERSDTYYVGRQRVSIYGGNNTLPAVDTTTESYGASAWKRFKPAQPRVNLGVFFGELTSVKDMVLKRLDSFKALGSNYLSVQFGWKPFLSDVRDWYTSLLALDRQIAQLQRDNGRWIKRGGVVDSGSNVSIQTLTASNGLILPLDANARNPRVHSNISTTYKTWFEGSFKYCIPNLNSEKWGRLRAIQELWNLKLTPSEVYQLIPFSWLVDWFTNAGDVLDNYQSQIDDRLVAKYAYVMRQVDETATIVASRENYQRVQATPVSSYVITYVPIVATSIVKRTTKSRAVANPFGFGLTGGVNSLYRTSIIIALGLSRYRI